MSNSGNKRQRSTNFSINETECLVDEVLKRAAVIENKRTDAVTWKQKEHAWRDLTETFNTLTAGNRTEKMLKIKYDGIKRSIKQKHNRGKSEQFMTGGGVAEVISYTPWEEKLLRLISLSVEGLPSDNDCDGVEYTYQSQLTSQSNVEIVYVDNEISEVKNDCNGDYTNMDQSEVESCTNAVTTVGISTPSTMETIYSMPSTSESFLQEANNTDKPIKVSNWDSWTPANLRSPANKKLKVSSQGRAVEDKYTSMANSREAVINLQRKVAEQEIARIGMAMEFLRKEDQRKADEHQIRMELLRKEDERKADEHQIKMELLRKEDEKKADEHKLRMELLQLKKEQLLNK